MFDDPQSNPLMASRQQLNLIRNILDQLTDLVSIPNRNVDEKTQYLVLQLSDYFAKLSLDIKKDAMEHQDLRALADIGHVINSSLEISEVLRIVMDTIIALTGAERCFLMLKNDKGNLSIRMARNWDQESIEQSDLAISRTIVNKVIETSKPIVTTNAMEDPRFGRRDSIVTHNLRSILCVPLVVKGKITGVIYADNRLKSGVFTKSGRDILAAFANQAAIAIENARLFNTTKKTLTEVTALKNLMNDVFTSITSGVITTDKMGNINFCNKAAGAILNVNPKSIQGKQITKCISLSSYNLNELINNVHQLNQPITGIETKSKFPERGDVHLSLSISPLINASGTSQGTVIVLDDMTERRRLEAQYRLFERMVSPALIGQLDPDKIRLGGERKLITALFADIRGYTKFSEGLIPEKLVSILNRYLSIAAEAILDYGGTIDKFQGDAVIAWFNAPIPQKDHTLRAIKSALDIQRKVRLLHKELSAPARLSYGIGIHSGEAILGLIGTEKRLDYTAIGDSINIAKRIQEKAIDNQILISAEAYQQVRSQIIAEPIEPLFAKGKSHPIKVFKVIALKQP
ncbi:MAG TPA: GAF domain-containing protein [Anaerolineae bacterium]|nr:GAF domain-containing protein [Anaerolineae bacterium]